MKNYLTYFLKDPKLYQYFLVGGTSALIDISFFILLRRILDLHYLILATLSFFAATAVNYLLCNHFVFNSQRRSASAKISLTYLVSAIGLSIHHTALFFAVEWLTFPLLFSKVFAMGMAFGWNYLSRKHFVFV